MSTTKNIHRIRNRPPGLEALNDACPSPAELAIASYVLMWLAEYYDGTCPPEDACSQVLSLDQHRAVINALIERRSRSEPAIKGSEYVSPTQEISHG